MQLDNIIEKRKSVRKYSNKKVDIKLIGSILEAATKAPSAGNIQNWRFIVVNDNKIKDELTKASMNQTWMKQAPIFIVICSDEKTVKDFYKKKGTLYAPQNCAIACTYIMLKATDLGLSTCWIGAFAPKIVQRILNLPPGLIPEAIITIGYEHKDHLPRKAVRTEFKKITYFNKFGQKELDFSIFPLSKNTKKSGKNRTGRT